MSYLIPSFHYVKYNQHFENRRGVMRHPATRKEEVIELRNGIRIYDPYRWLEEETPEVKEWINLQSKYTEEYLRNLPFRNVIKNELVELFSCDDFGIPVPCKNRYFFSQRKVNQDMRILYFQHGIHGDPHALIDEASFSEDKSATLRWWVPSPDGRFIAYQVSKYGNDKGDIRIMDVDRMIVLEDYIPDDVYPMTYSPSIWKNDNSGFFYTRRGEKEVQPYEEKFYQRVYFHKLGENWEDDQLVFGEFLGKADVPVIEQSEDGRWLLINVFRQSERYEFELYLLDSLDYTRCIRVIEPVPDTKFYGKIHRNNIYILTDKNAPNGMIMRISVEDAINRSSPKPFISEERGVIVNFFPIRDRIFIETVENACSKLKEYSLDGEFIKEIELPTLGTISQLSFEPEGNELFFFFESFAFPRTIYRLDIIRGGLEIFKKMDLAIPDIFETEQIWYQSKDGTKIPMFLIYRKGITKNGDNPTVLYGYGGFEISITPSFMRTIIPFISRGGIFAIANIRGGGEFGKEWHEAGMRKSKQTVFDDFISGIEFLIKERWTRKDRLLIKGASNGGLLVCAVMTQRPDLMKAVVAEVPVTDMARYHLFHGGRYWIAEYGDPDDPDMLKYLLSYSPYHNVKDSQHYPAVLIATGEADDRVHPMHSYKMIARLQEANTGSGPILLKVEEKVGHGRISNISKIIEDQTDIWSFIFDQLKMNV
jgi:prolyl oligopeptidase